MTTPRCRTLFPRDLFKHELGLNLTNRTKSQNFENNGFFTGVGSWDYLHYKNLTVVAKWFYFSALLSNYKLTDLDENYKKNKILKVIYVCLL